MDVVVADADTVVVLEVDGRVFEEKFEDVVRVAVGAGDGPEHPDACGGGAQHLQYAQRNG